jgi:ribA/ribD-fused uncharacterized protein
MRVILKPGMLVVVAETDPEREAWATWRQSVDDHAFHFIGSSDGGGPFHDIGPIEVARREPINVVFTQVEERWRPISNLAHSPFTLDGRNYASVEGFWQCLKFESETERARVAKLSGMAAKQVAAPRSATGSFHYEGRVCALGGPEHHRLMLRACWAKFSQHGEARKALLDTGDRILCHRTPRDSQTIPGALMADVWMRIRGRLQRKGDDNLDTDPPIASEEPDGRILFFDRDRVEFGFLSHFYPSPIELDGEHWPTVEHYYQAQRSFDPAYRDAIRAAETPARAKQLAANPEPGRWAAQASWFIAAGKTPRADWPQVKLDIMRRADHAKYTQNADLCGRLLATGTASLVEDSPHDGFWGTGRDGAGLNWAGRILMEVREELQTGGED